MAVPIRQQHPVRTTLRRRAQFFKLQPWLFYNCCKAKVPVLRNEHFVNSQLSQHFPSFISNFSDKRLPSICLVVLQIATLILPPKAPDRAVFSITVLLAFAIMQTIINGQIPMTAQIILIVLYIACQMTLGTVITIYCLVTCQLARFPHFKTSRKIRPPTVMLLAPLAHKFMAPVHRADVKISYIRLIDLIAVCIAVLALLTIHVAIFVQMMAS